MRLDSDFVEGRWLPPWDEGASENYAFVSNKAVARVLRIAETNVHIDPNTTLVKLRQFGELLARLAAPAFGVHPGREETQDALLGRLKGSRGPGREVLEPFYQLKEAGNAAVHEHRGDLSQAAAGLRKAQLLAWWFETTVGGRRLPKPKFKLPEDPRVLYAALVAEVRQQEQQAAELRTANARAKAHVEEAERRAKEEASERLEAERARRGQEEEARTWQLLAEEQERRRFGPSIAHGLAALQQDIVGAGFDEPDSAGLPDWVASVIAGDDPPEGLPEEIVEDLRALATVLPVPPIETPAVTVESAGNLAATARVPLTIRPSIRHPNSLSPAEVQGAVWVDAAGNEFLVPQRLRAALEQLAEGPPHIEEGQASKDATRSRQLWWGRLRRSLEEFGVDLRGYLGATDAVVVDRLKPRLVIREDGTFEVRFSAPDLTEDEATSLVDGADIRRPRDPVLRQRGADGGTQRKKVFLSDLGRRSVSRAAQVRRMGQNAGPYLQDAPDSVFDPELFDLSEYGDRVIGFGRPVYRVSPSMASGDRGRRFTLTGVPGADGAEPPELTESEQSELAEKLTAAAAKGLDYVPFKGAWIRVPTPEAAADLGSRHEDTRQGGVLLVDENTETLSYQSPDLGEGGRALVPQRPPGIAADAELMPHQLDGFSWLAGHALGAEGATDHGLLADDMGLGKTLQVLSLMSLLRDAGRLRSCLLVAPLSLLDNWCSEADRFFPGRFTNRIRLGGGVRLTARSLRNYDLVLVSYETLRSQQLELGRVRWSLMVCDECHRIRNPTALTTKAILAMDAECRLGLSGTPVQNSLVDIWSQFDWLAPGLLGDLHSFKQRFDRREDGAVPLPELRSAVAPRVLRRLKKDVIAHLLPPKHVQRHELPMDPGQVSLYDELLAEFSGARGSAFKTLPRLMQVSADPSLVALGLDESPGPKLRWLLAQLLKIEQLGEKAIVFAEWYSLQDRVAALLEGAFGVPVDRINGSVEAGLRLAKIDAFSRRPGFGVLVLGPKATGVGLNITAANHVIHLTRHWNPALESQATDRTYRIGQTRPVHVYLPIAIHPHLRSIDEHLDQLLAAKEDVAEDFLSGFDDLSVSAELEAALHGGSR